MGVFAQHSEAYADAGLPAFPVDTLHKRPAVRGWQKATPRLARTWAHVEKLGNADGLGIVMGKPSGITEIDVDAASEAWLAAAVERFGETPIVIGTATGKAKLWYRHNGEDRKIRPFRNQPIDVLGGGFTIAPPSWREDLGAAYAFRSGGLGDIANLPTIRADALGFDRPAETVQTGERNNHLWRYCMTQARYCDDVEALLDVAASWASTFPDPLPVAEVERTARSAWKYEAAGRNYVGLRKPQLSEGDRIMDALIDKPDALVLYQLLVRWHQNKSDFSIAPRAMSEAGNPPWSRQRIARTRDVLLERRFLEELRAPSRHRSGLYRLRTWWPVSGNNHYTPFSPAYGEGRQPGGRASDRD
ncbi:bifunctional DNA primase/polymerase [Aliiruegeria sabulilitoris]|uniref:bifunctional DNA primase/polymerase n=1 Tax=Aliiruegeria sabulilitoris TaxID=1510458 RepID=UPI00083737DA|nr:bifunctional DNA primase/polymerase [Aliiruegeria sabulilitoris]NDR59196.1 hypothetical protein [Pseudoruegeria sp. M32A2M]